MSSPSCAATNHKRNHARGKATSGDGGYSQKPAGTGTARHSQPCETPLHSPIARVFFRPPPGLPFRQEDRRLPRQGQAMFLAAQIIVDEDSNHQNAALGPSIRDPAISPGLELRVRETPLYHPTHRQHRSNHKPYAGRTISKSNAMIPLRAAAQIIKNSHSNVTPSFFLI
ncbi:hypothetical protein DEO72_LG3g3144 [Vigna unguiculata]|uniref:Uncharacterized protein n=1 Tax=Vigna unguiculata TaxID=3917 RepID=A0A4D6LJW2_VIGUN|nr:hypothetical protein DEO72_LG3g3144 [Vigna unguiculata]